MAFLIHLIIKLTLTACHSTFKSVCWSVRALKTAIARLALCPFQLQYRALVLHRTSASFMQPEIDRLFTESPQSFLMKLHVGRSRFSSASEWTRPAREPVAGFFYSFVSAAFWLWVDFCETDASVWKPVLFYVFAQCTQAWLGALG